MPQDDRVPPDDTRLRLLFTHPRMVRDLFLGFVREPWVERLDFAALEPWGESVAGPEISWRLRFQGGRGWIHLLLALAPEVDRNLPVRLAGRIVMLLLELARQGGLPRSRRLPAVVPLVLYHGEALWTVPRQLADLFDPVPHGLERTLPRLSPLVLDVRREPLPETAARDNLAALLFALERSRSLADLDRGPSRPGFVSEHGGGRDRRVLHGSTSFPVRAGREVRGKLGAGSVYTSVNRYSRKGPG